MPEVRSLQLANQRLTRVLTGATLLHSAAEIDCDGVIARALLKFRPLSAAERTFGKRPTAKDHVKALCRTRDVNHMTAWHRACSHGNRAVMEILLNECDQEANEPCKFGVTAAHILAKVRVRRCW